MSSIGRTPALGCRKGFLTAGALVSESMILNDSPILYFSHMALLSAIGKAPWRRTTTAVADSLGSRNVYAKASGKSRNWPHMRLPPDDDDPSAFQAS